jgi:hypothetical protein
MGRAAVEPPFRIPRTIDRKRGFKNDPQHSALIWDAETAPPID